MSTSAYADRCKGERSRPSSYCPLSKTVSNTALLELDQSWVKVDIEILADRMLFKIENNKVASNGNGNQEGIGIANARRVSFDLLYPGNHELKILRGDETFLVILTINQP